MEWLLFVLSFPESYVVIVPYLALGLWVYRVIHRSHFASVWALLLMGLVFWVIFLLGLAAVIFAAGIVITFRHAERV